MASAVFAPALRRPPPVQNHFELQFGALSLACALAIAIGAPSFTNGGPSPGIRANDPMGPPELHAPQLACAQEFIHSAPTDIEQVGSSIDGNGQAIVEIDELNIRKFAHAGKMATI